MGHEFSAEVLEAGPDTEAPPPGTIVTSLPMLLSPRGFEPICLQQHHRRRLRRADAAVGAAAADDPQRPRPAPRGAHRADGGRPARGEQVGDPAAAKAPWCIGCGPIGLAIIAALRQRGVEHIVAADYLTSKPARTGDDDGCPPGGGPGASRRSAVRRAAGRRWCSRPSASRESSTTCCGGHRSGTRLVVAGVCMEPDTDHAVLRHRQGDQRAVRERPTTTTEFAESLRAIAEGEIDVAPTDHR